MFMDICNPSENSCFSKIFPVLLKCDFSWFQPIIGRFYKMRVSWEFNIYNLKSFLLTRCYRFLTRCEYYLWLDSKYNVRRCDVLVQNKTIHSLNLFALDRILSLKMATWAIGKTFHVIRGRVVCIIVFIVSIWSDLLCVSLMICQILWNVFTWRYWLRNKVRSCWHSEEIQPTDVWYNVLKSSYRKIWSNI